MLNIRQNNQRRKTPEMLEGSDNRTNKKVYKQTYTIPKAWRALHLISTLSTTLERIIHTRIREQIDEIMSPTQFGSREIRLCADMLSVIDRWTEEMEQRGIEYTKIQVDVEGGFDKIEPKRIIDDIPKEYKRWIQ
jgi:hypothetical protein